MRTKCLFTIVIALTIVLLVVGSGCGIMKTAVDVPGKTVRAITPGMKGKNVPNPVEVQQNLLRFADEYAMSMVVGVDKLRRGTNAPDPAEILKWKIALGTETCAIASGPNAVANLLDMTIFITVTRMSLEEHWGPKVFGDSAVPLLASCRNSESEIWRLTGGVLTLAQQSELRAAIAEWHRQHPLPESVLAARTVSFATQVAMTSKVNPTETDSVFNLLNVDPLAGLDPAVRELSETRLFAERALYVTQKMPMLLRWQTELLSINAVQMPAIRQLVANSTQIAASVDRFAAVAEKLPGQVSAERAEILKSLQSQEKDAASLMVTGTQMSDSLNTTLKTFDALMKRFGVGETNSAGPAVTNAEPFRIQAYAQTAVQLEAAARQLTELLVTLNQTLDSTNLAKLSAQVGPVVQQAQAGGKELADYAFWKGILLIVTALMAALIYRFLSVRMLANKSKSNLQ